MNTDELPESPVAAIRRLDVASGHVDWKVPLESASGAQAVILTAGGIELPGYDSTQRPSILSFAPATGALTTSAYGLELYDSESDLAVGADGSLYIVYQTGVGTAATQAFLARLDPETHAVVWSSTDILSLGPPPRYTADGASVGDIALGRGDVAVVVNDTLVPGDGGTLTNVSVASAFDPTTGAVLWTTTLSGQLFGGPVVRADGSIVVVVGPSGLSSASLVTLEPASGAATTLPLSGGVFGIDAVAYDGTVIVATDSGNGVEGAMAVATDGTVRWTKPGVLDATIASDGSVVGRLGTTMGGATSIVALDPMTGHTQWQLDPPVSGYSIWYVALSSDGALVAEQGDGTVFGASD